MNFIKTTNTKPLEDSLVRLLEDALEENDKVLWLVPGGSNVEVVASVMKRLGKLAATKRLTLMLSDERYGDIGHIDSNYQQFMDADLMLADAILEPTLIGGSMEATSKHTIALSKRLFEEANIVIAFLGMGADGHVAGILPGSPAVDSSEWAIGYDAGKFKRITLTPTALLRADIVIVGAYGEEKKPALTQLRDESLPLAEQPAQLLKQIRSVTIFNNQIGEEL